MYKTNQILSWTNKKSIIVICDSCNKEFNIKFKNAEKNRKKNGKHICSTCKGIKLKPQNLSSYWNSNKRKDQSNSVKFSESYREAIKKINRSGINNGMFEKTHSVITKNKMSISRKGKIGAKANAWKGGKSSINVRIKRMLHTKYNWFLRVFERDNYTCQDCGIKNSLDAHHIEPISILIKQLVNNNFFKNEDDKIKFLINHPKIVDQNLQNGKTLCRNCHKKAHKKWGSHYARV